MPLPKNSSTEKESVRLDAQNPIKPIKISIQVGQN